MKLLGNILDALEDAAPFMFIGFLVYLLCNQLAHAT